MMGNKVFRVGFRYMNVGLEMNRKVVDLYIDSVKGISQGRNPYIASKNPHQVRRRLGSLEDNIKITSTAHSGWSEREQELIEFLRSMSKKYDFVLEFHDVQKAGQILRAYFKGVKRVPCVVIGREKFYSKITEKELIKALGKPKSIGTA